MPTFLKDETFRSYLWGTRVKVPLHPSEAQPCSCLSTPLLTSPTLFSHFIPQARPFAPRPRREKQNPELKGQRGPVWSPGGYSRSPSGAVLTPCRPCVSQRPLDTTLQAHYLQGSKSGLKTKSDKNLDGGGVGRFWIQGEIVQGSFLHYSHLSKRSPGPIQGRLGPQPFMLAAWNRPF